MKSGIDKLKLCVIDTDLQIELEQLRCHMNDWECMDEKLKDLEFRVAEQFKGHDQQLHAHSDKLDLLHQRVKDLEAKGQVTYYCL